MKITLYKSATCPQCKVAKTKLEQKKISFTEIYVENLSATELDTVGVKSIPTLVIDTDSVITKLTSIRDISNWINKQEVSNG